MKYIVTKPFKSTVQHSKGETVELDGPNVQKLVDQRYLAVPGSEAAKAAQAEVKAAAEPTPAPAPVVAPEAVKAPEAAPAPVKKKRGRPPKVKPPVEPATVTLQ